MKLDIQETNRLSATDMEFFVTEELKAKLFSNKVDIILNLPSILSELTEIFLWCCDQLKGRWFSPEYGQYEYYMVRNAHSYSGIGASDYINHIEIYFEEESDKIAFKVRWSGDAS